MTNVKYKNKYAMKFCFFSVQEQIPTTRSDTEEAGIICTALKMSYPIV